MRTSFEGSGLTIFNWMSCGRTRVSGQESQEVWVWAALEATTRIVLVIQLGPRTLEMAHAGVHKLRQRMSVEMALPVFSSDGLRLYFYALTVYFGRGSRQTVGGSASRSSRPT